MNNQNKEKYGRRNNITSYEFEKKNTTVINLLIIREIFKFINASKAISLEDFYTFLFTYALTPKNNVNINSNKRPQRQYDKKHIRFTMSTYLSSQVGNITPLIASLISYGISSEFFDNTKIPVSPDLWTSFSDYIITDFKKGKKCDSKNDAENDAKVLKKLQNTLLKQIYTIRNLDGTFLIESIRNIIMDMTNTDISKNYNNNDISLLNEIDNYDVPHDLSYTQNNIVKLYSQMAKNKLDNNTVIDVKPCNLSKISPKTNNEFVCDNLFIIIKTYQMLADIDLISDADEKLRIYLNLSDKDYQNLSDDKSVEINNKEIAQKLSKYRYRILFRTDHTTTINLSNQLNDAFADFKINHDIALFKFRLKFWLTYNIDTHNNILVLGTYSLYNSLNKKSPKIQPNDK